MKKFFAVLIVFALIFAACSGGSSDNNDENNDNDNGNDNNGNTQNNSDVIGVWTGTYKNFFGEGQVNLDIADGTWVLLITAPNSLNGTMTTYNGTWTRSGNTLTLSRTGSNSTASASLSGSTLILNQPWTTDNYGPRICTLTKSGSEGDEEPLGSTTLRIRNESFIGITDVIWNNVKFKENSGVIATGTSEIKSITAGSGYIYFKREGNPVPVRTNAQLFDEDKENEFVFRNTTPVTEVSNTGNSAVLETFFSKPWIYLKQVNGTVTNIIDLYGEYDFGSVLKGENKDITFTVQNIGLANLVIESVDGKRVNLDENTEGYFTVTQQPLASSITPESTAAFTIRFSPAIIGNNFTASVIIKTNSQNAEEFAFRVKGNGRDYIFGDTGPGGGMIFFVQGGQYKECSGELGISTWQAAVTNASNHNGGGFTNWRLPTIGELTLMYENLHKDKLGGFFGSSIDNNYYWSSEETTTTSGAYCVIFSNGFGYSSNKTSAFRVRAVRSFSSQ